MSSAPVASYHSKTQSHKENRQYNKLLNHFSLPLFFDFVCLPNGPGKQKIGIE
jgi:hypothetical protein